MIRFREIELPEGVVEFFQRVITTTSDADLIAYAKSGNPMLLKGLRPTKDNAGRVRERFVKRLAVGKKISSSDAGFLTCHNPYALFDDLDLKALTDALPGLCASLSEHKIAAGLLLSRREEFWKLAGQLLSGELKLKKLSTEEAETFARNAYCSYLPFLQELVPVFSEEPEEPVEEKPAPESNAKNAAAEEECARLRESLAQLKKDLKGAKRDSIRVKELEKKLERSEARRDAAAASLAELTDKLTASRKEFDQLHSAIGSQVDEELSSLLRSWLIKPQDLQRELDRSAGTDLIAQATSLIEKQQEVDRHCGNRAALTDRLQAAHDARDQLATLSRESLNPLPELADMLDELDREIVRLQAALEKEGALSSFAKNFMTQLGLARSPDDVMVYKRMLESLKDTGVLDLTELRVLFDYCDQRMDLAYDHYAPAAPVYVPSSDPFRRQKESIQHNAEMTWFLDGHNILFALEEVFGARDASGAPTEEARYNLSEALITLVAQADQCQVRLYFDGPDHSEYSPSDNVKIIYSGGTGDHRADDIICSDMEYLRSIATTVPFFITTDDRGLRTQTAHLNAQSLAVDDLRVLLRSAAQ